MTNKEKILLLESRLDFVSYKYKEFLIWPVIRISLIFSKKQLNVGQKVSLLKRFNFLILGFKELLKYKIGLWPKAKNVFLTSSHYKVEENKLKYDRIIHPFQDYLTNHNQEYVVFEYTNQYEYNLQLDYSARVIKIQPVIFFLTFFWRIIYVFNSKGKFKGDFELLNHELKNLNISIQIDEKFFRKIFLLERQAKFFEKVLKKTKAEKVGVVCYYDFKSLALMWASNNLKIPTIDFQHGIQGFQHSAYADWQPELSENSVFFPSHFWVWDSFSHSIIKNWKKEEHVLLGCNKWIQERIVFKKPEIILYTAQPLPNPLPTILLEVIQRYDGPLKWFIRIHPQQINEFSRFQNIIIEKGIKDKVNLLDATYKPLTELLAKTSIHITKSSSVAIEASYYGIPTIFLDKTGSRYKEILTPNLIHFPLNVIELLDLLNKHESNKGDMQSLTINNDLQRFENISLFYNA